MKTLVNEPLSNPTTIKIGGIAEKYKVPETTDELMSVVKDYNPHYFIGEGQTC